MRSHRHGQQLVGQFHELGIDGSHQHHWPFDQAGDFIEKPRVVLDREAFFLGEFCRFLFDQRPTLDRIEDHVCFFSLAR